MDSFSTPESGAWEALPCLGKLHIAKNQFPQWIHAFGGYVFSDWAQALPLAIRIQCIHLVYLGWSGNREGRVRPLQRRGGGGDPPLKGKDLLLLSLLSWNSLPFLFHPEVTKIPFLDRR